MEPLMRAMKDVVRRASLWIGLCILAVFFSLTVPISEALWAKVLVISGEIETSKHKRGTSIEAEKSAEGYLVQVDEVWVYGVRGQVCVNNIGDYATSELQIHDQVQYKLAGKGKFQDLGGATQTIVPVEQLAPDESACYSYDIVFTPAESAKAYRNIAHITITNQAGHMGEPFGPWVKADFTLPQQSGLGLTKPVRPILECVIHHGDGTYSAIFGYLNENDTPVVIPIGADNKFTPSPEDRGQPALFEPGRTPYDVGVFSVVFDGGNLVWTLDGHTSTASSGSKECPLEPNERNIPLPTIEAPPPFEIVTPPADDILDS